MSIQSKILAVLRIAIGLILIVSGAEKILAPYQNFLYVIQSYELGLSSFETIAAQVFPWVELIIGTFLVLGLWLAWSLRAAMIIFLTFIVIVGQALVRKLPLSECGCFGELIHLPPQVVLLMDSTIFAVIGIQILKIKEAAYASLDRYFEKNG